ncbi:hypothetical protein MP228_003451 [Amoeboaphelidium protococcarum]|nr:hypothetical protein MP228_003451 [Amoeboaphelidium protococcarum]
MVVLQMTSLHYNNPTSAQGWAEDATITCVPTSAGASGRNSVVSFLKKNPSLNVLSTSNAVEARDFSNSDEGVWIKNKFESDHMSVLELVVRFTHSGEMLWLLPGVKGTNRSVTVAFVIITEYEVASGDNQQQVQLVRAKRIYWDQAAVMRQIYLLPSDVSRLPMSNQFPVSAQILPVATSDAVNRLLYEEQDGSSNCLEKQLTGVDVQINRNQFSSSTTTRGVYKSSVTADPYHHQSHFSIGQDDEYVPQQEQGERHGKRLAQNSTNVSHFSLGDDYAGGKDIYQPPKSAKKMFPNTQVDHLDQKSPSGRSSPTRHGHHKGHNAAAARRNDSHHDIFGGYSGNEKSKSAATAGNQQEPGDVGKWASSSNGLGSVQNRPSSRVLNVPGGKSSIRFA